MLRVHINSLARWAKAGKITAVYTPGGHRRYLETEVKAIAAARAQFTAARDNYRKAFPDQAEQDNTHAP